MDRFTIFEQYAIVAKDFVRRQKKGHTTTGMELFLPYFFVGKVDFLQTKNTP